MNRSISFPGETIPICTADITVEFNSRNLWKGSSVFYSQESSWPVLWSIGPERKRTSGVIRRNLIEIEWGCWRWRGQRSVKRKCLVDTHKVALVYDRSCCWGVYGAVVAVAFRERNICVSWYIWEEQKMSKGENGSEDDVVGRERCCAAARLLTHLGGNHQRRGMDVEWAQLVGHDHIVDVLLSRFLQLKYENKKKDARTSKNILLFLL